ncbi:class III extradiol ring-cleavage dioxygenase [Neisseriaceae bacterium CLB008]|nr:dioxygenase [Neisseriaceae bacterium]
MKQLPVLFVSHGSPMMAIEPGVVGPKLQDLGQKLLARHTIKAVLVVSAHWQTESSVGITAQAQPGVIHDFYGFPPALYELDYDTAGAPDWAMTLHGLLAAAGVPAQLSQDRGLDHGAWVPLRYLFPEADQAVVQMALPHPLSGQQAYDLGRLLQPLRDQGVLIVGSGSLTHNLRDLGRSALAAPYVIEFTQWIKEKLASKDVASIVDYRVLAPHAVRAHPSEEHFLPLLVALGASVGSDAVAVMEGGIEYEALSMDGFVFSAEADAYLNSVAQ